MPKAAELRAVFSRSGDAHESKPSIMPRHPGGFRRTRHRHLDTLHLIEIRPAIAALQARPPFPSELVGSLKQWFRDYTGWMLTADGKMKPRQEQSRGGLLVAGGGVRKVHGR